MLSDGKAVFGLQLQKEYCNLVFLATSGTLEECVVQCLQLGVVVHGVREYRSGRLLETFCANHVLVEGRKVEIASSRIATMMHGGWSNVLRFETFATHSSARLRCQFLLTSLGHRPFSVNLTKEQKISVVRNIERVL